MKREIITTADGSRTIQITDWAEQYHSVHGAIQEAEHVYITQGLQAILEADTKINPIAILEIGFGTGLNAILTLLAAKKYQSNVRYTAVEAFPVSKDEIEQLNYTALLTPKLAQAPYYAMHNTPWEQEVVICPNFQLRKQQKKFQDITVINQFNLIYFDAFGPRVQPELWTETIFLKMFQALKPDGILVTYSAKGSVRRAMQAVGFTVERLPGPPGKREMLRARKTSS
ncbi:tRNA (5-methylaminomethyl-2-thiouridine)(34)-methyltransferase MnmD [Bizionia sediminis]|uniref:tRNA (5-methylaminomethyl-2-thiouridine)(34)-methyltransferase MnmD n=1 Tax=Bizionia sediminis TaxID=1737064 RepID=A0ABW5KRB7_9FLAO